MPLTLHPAIASGKVYANLRTISFNFLGKGENLWKKFMKI